MKEPRAQSKARGFARASTLLKSRIREASEARGFSESRLLTRWSEIAGPDIAEISRPVEVSYGRGGLGATLTVLTTGAQAPMLEMKLPALIEKVNACYGYAAIKRIRLTQTAPTGFAEGQASFDAAPPRRKLPTTPAPEIAAEAQKQTQTVDDTGLRDALSRLGANVISKQRG